MRLSRQERQQRLAERIRQDPLQTDEELAKYFGVSVPTIRLDRLHLGIPELRLRSEGLARQAVTSLRALSRQEMVGELVDLELGRSARSVLDTDPSMAFARSQVLRSHYLFAQADSLALAVVDGDVVLTGLVNAKFTRPVMAGERLTAAAEIVRRSGPRYIVQVVSRTREDVVFRAKFVVFALEPFGVSRGGLVD